VKTNNKKLGPQPLLIS